MAQPMAHRITLAAATINPDTMAAIITNMVNFTGVEMELTKVCYNVPATESLESRV